MIVDSLLSQIEEGRSGRHQGFSMGLPKLEGVIDGVMQSTYTLIFSNSGTGKTSFALYSYIFKPSLEHLNDNKFKVIYYSLEMSAEMLFAKLLSMYIFETFGVVLTTKEILSSKRGYTLSDESYEYIKESLNYLRSLENIITVFDKGLDSDVLYSSLLRELGKRGNFTEEGNRKLYIPDDPETITLVVIDHMSLVRPKDGRSLKQEIDLISSYLVSIRNRCKISPLVIMQANRESSSMARRQEGMSNMTLNDIKDSGAPIMARRTINSVKQGNSEKTILC